MPKRLVSIPITKSYYGIGFKYVNLWAERFQEIIEGLVTGGIVNFLLQKMTKSKWNLMKIEDHSEKIVLNLSHLGFGFQICFFALYGALLIFLMEFVVYWIKNRSRVVEKSNRGTVLIKTDIKVAIATEESINQEIKAKLPEIETVFGDHVKPSSNMSSSGSVKEVDFVFGEKVKDNSDLSTENVAVIFLVDLIYQNKN